MALVERAHKTGRSLIAASHVLGELDRDPRFLTNLDGAGNPMWDRILDDRSWSEGERVLLRTAATLESPLGGHGVLLSELCAFLDDDTLRRVLRAIGMWRGWTS